MVVLKVSLISRKKANVLSALAKEQWNVHSLRSQRATRDGSCHRWWFVGADGSCAVCLACWGIRCLAAHIPLIIPTEQAGSRSSGRLWLGTRIEGREGELAGRLGGCPDRQTDRVGMTEIPGDGQNVVSTRGAEVNSGNKNVCLHPEHLL